MLDVVHQEIVVVKSNSMTQVTVKRSFVQLQGNLDPRKKRNRSQEEREERVQDCMEELRRKHGTKFTPMQYRI